MQHSSAENSWRNYDRFFLEKDFFVHTLLLAAEQLNDEMKKFFLRYKIYLDSSRHCWFIV